MINTDYPKEYFFNIDDYLIEWYPKMDMPTRRSICALVLEVLDSEDLEPIVDEVVNDYAKKKVNLEKLEQEDEDDE